MECRRESLTAAQSALAADAGYIGLALQLARAQSCKFPHLADEFESAALVALVDAAATFDARYNVPFFRHARRRIIGAMIDCQRHWMPSGYRRCDSGDAPRVGSLDLIRAYDDTGRSLTLCDLLASDEDPADWGAEYQDELAVLIRSLPRRDRAVLELRYGHAATASAGGTARAVGISESRVFQIQARAISVLEEAAS